MVKVRIMVRVSSIRVRVRFMVSNIKVLSG